jgi:hypothetical protein
MQDHGIGNVGHVELIKTNELVTFRHASTQFIQGIDGALHQGQLAVNFAHELVKMQARFALRRGTALKKQSIKEALAST